MAETAIIACGEWRHRKGHHYLVLGLASDSNNVDPHAEPQVVYVSLSPNGRTGLPMHVRSLREFLDRFEPVENGRSTPCENYTARSWSPGPERPEDARCVNCNQSHGPAVGGSESRVAPGQPADGERSAPPTDLGLDSGR